MHKSSASKKHSPAVVGRWRHRLVDGQLPSHATRLDEPPHGILAKVIRIRPQPYPVPDCGDFYFKSGKFYSLVYRGKIGTFEQWSRARGISVDNLRARIRSGLAMDEVMSKRALIQTDHSIDGSTAERYCRCAHCLNKRVLAWQSSLEPIESEHLEDAGKLFRRNDGSLFIKFKGEVLDVQTVADRLGLKYQTLHARVFRYGWPLKRALAKK